jgi:hypothetical protein
MELLKDIGLISAEKAQNYQRTKKESPYDTRLRLNWESRYKDLLIFKLKHGHCIVTKQQDLSLSHWVSSQRAEYKRGNMPEDRISKLNEVGMLSKAWQTKLAERPEHATNWNLSYERLVAYKAEHGTCRVSRKEDASLQKWVHRQISQRKKDNISEERVAKLEEIGLFQEHHEHNRDWNAQYDKLVAYKLEHGTCRVSRKVEFIEISNILRRR